jgi:hypothetical protein
MLNNTRIQINKGYRSLIANTSINCGEIILEETPFAIATFLNDAHNRTAHHYGWPWAMTFELVQMLKDKKFASKFKGIRLHSNHKFPLDDIDTQILHKFPKKLGIKKRDLLDLYFTVATNNYFLAAPGGYFGITLYKYISAANHSCIPNAYSTNELKESSSIGKVIALTDIEEGEEITISYVTDENNYLDPLAVVNELPDVAKRREHIYQKHYFQCLCHRCTTQSL